jgi:hypothetical protein
MKKVYTIKRIKEVLANYDGHYFKDDGYHVVCLDLIDEYFKTRKELLAWATFTFWNRDMVARGER